jgi:hypothetical protein
MWDKDVLMKEFWMCVCDLDISSGASCRVLRLVCVVYPRNPICNQSECPVKQSKYKEVV